MPKLPRDQRSIDRLPTPSDRPVEYASDKVRGLRLEIRPNGSRRYRLKFRVGSGRAGRSFKTWTLGDATQIGIGRAEVEARARLAEIVLKGEDPRPAQIIADSGAQASTVDALVRLWIERHGKQHKRSWERDLDLHERLIGPRLGAKATKAITRQEVLSALDDVAAKVGPIQANRVQAVISACFSWALDEGLIETHPAYRLRKRGKEKARDRHLSSDELRRLWLALDGLPPHIADAMRLLALTGQRRSEIGGMQTSELELGRTPVWTLPSVRSKNKLAHSLPLPPLALAIIERNLPTARGPYVFPSRLIEPKAGRRFDIVGALRRLDAGTRNRGRQTSRLAAHRQNWARAVGSSRQHL